MLRVIVLGPYTGEILDVARNIRRGMDLATEAALAGFWVWPCWCDWDLATRAELPMEWFKGNTMAWLECADAILLAPGWENSVGVKAELQRAAELMIPAFDNIYAIQKYARNEASEGICVIMKGEEPERTEFPGVDKWRRHLRWIKADPRILGPADGET